MPSALFNSLGFLLNKTAQLIRETFEEPLLQLGITSREVGILSISASSGPHSQRELGQRFNPSALASTPMHFAAGSHFAKDSTKQQFSP
jgi:hypothetical protein